MAQEAWKKQAALGGCWDNSVWSVQWWISDPDCTWKWCVCIHLTQIDGSGFGLLYLPWLQWFLLHQSLTPFHRFSALWKRRFYKARLSLSGRSRHQLGGFACREWKFLIGSPNFLSVYHKQAGATLRDCLHRGCSYLWALDHSTSMTTWSYCHGCPCYSLAPSLCIGGVHYASGQVWPSSRRGKIWGPGTLMALWSLRWGLGVEMKGLRVTMQRSGQRQAELLLRRKGTAEETSTQNWEYLGKKMTLRRGEGSCGRS